jgi:hypothetical protein
VKNWLVALARRILGLDRPKIIGVFGATRAEVERGIRHAQTGAGDLPIWAWCAEETPADAVTGCARFTSGPRASWFFRDLLEVRPALSIVGWTGKPGHLALKVLPLAVPPFRVVAFNEAGGFFAPRPALIFIHLKRRLRDARAAKWKRFAGWVHSLCFRAGEHIADGLNWIWESLLAMLAFVAQWCAPLAHAAMRNVRSGQPAFVPFEESLDDTFTEITIPNRGWPLRAV